jgi:hypothetical protein
LVAVVLALQTAKVAEQQKEHQVVIQVSLGLLLLLVAVEQVQTQVLLTTD